MAERMHKASEGLVGDVRQAVKGFTGAGDAIRGTAMETLDGVFHKKDGQAQNKEIADRGLANMRDTEEHFQHGHGHDHHTTTTTGTIDTSSTARSATPPTSNYARSAATIATSPTAGRQSPGVTASSHGHTAGQGSHFKH